MTVRYICTYDRGTVAMDDDAYLQTVLRFQHTLVRLAEVFSHADDPVVAKAKVEITDLLTLQRSLCALIHLAKDHGLNSNLDVRHGWLGGAGFDIQDVLAVDWRIS